MTQLQINSHALLPKLTTAMNLAREKQKPVAGVVSPVIPHRNAEARFHELFDLIAFVEAECPILLSLEDASLILKYQS